MLKKEKTKLKTIGAKLQIDGNADFNSEKDMDFEITTVEQLLGDGQFNKYHTSNEQEYENYLKEMNKTDLQAHAINVGLIPIDNRLLLGQRLVKEFRKQIATYQRPKSKVNQASKSLKNNKVPEDIQKIISGGR